MNSRNIPYEEITPRQKEFLFHFVNYIAELLTRKKEDYDFPDYSKQEFIRIRTSYGIKHDLQSHFPADRARYVKEVIFADFPDFERFYCTNDTFKQAMLDCNVKFKKDKGDINWSFRGGYQNDKVP